MDKAIPPQIKKARQKRVIVKMLVFTIIIISGFILLINVFQPGISGNNIMIRDVDKGALEISVYATGKVTPTFEEIITSPVSTKILEIYKKAGEQVEEGDVLLQLDLETIKADFDTKKEELDMRFRKLELQKATIENNLADLKMQLEIDEMQLKRVEVMLYNEKYLDSIGASTPDKIKQAELDFIVKQMQSEQLKRKYQHQLKSSEIEIKSLELDYKTAQRNMALLTKTLGEAQVKSPRSATLVWINEQIGAAVQPHGELAIISDLSNYKVEAEIMDSYADKITSGNRVNIKLGNDKLTGIVSNVTPSVKNGIIKFTVLLEENDHSRLRSGLKVDVHVTYALRDNVLRLAYGSYYVGSGEYELWVVNNNEAVKRKVVLGENSFEQVEVVSGLNEGERVIISDMGRYQEKNKLKIK